MRRAEPEQVTVPWVKGKSPSLRGTALLGVEPGPRNGTERSQATGPRLKGPDGSPGQAEPLAPSSAQGRVLPAALFCLHVGAPCPQGCLCPELAGAVAVHCSARGLQEVPRDIPADAVLLKLDANDIAYVPDGVFRRLSQLRELDLSRNAIETLGPAAFAGLAGGLRLLDLSHNRLRRIPKDALGPLGARVRLSHNPLHCECALQEALWELRLDPDAADEIACRTSEREELVGRPLIQALDAGANLCGARRRTTDVAMLATMFGWFAMVVTYLAYYVRQNQAATRRHLQYLKSLPSVPDTRDPAGLAP